MGKSAGDEFPIVQRPFRVLLAEHSFINKHVITAMLVGLCCKVVVMGNDAEDEQGSYLSAGMTDCLTKSAKFLERLALNTAERIGSAECHRAAEAD